MDTTSDKGIGDLLLCLDGWRSWVLNAVKIASENESELQPAIAKTVSAFGHPVAIMRDLVGAGAKAVAQYRQQAIPDLVCRHPEWQWRRFAPR